MMISTRGRYALRVMIDLAEHRNDSYIPLKEIAARQEVSLKYLERILPDLTKNRLVEGAHGKGGGYHLTREPEEYTIGEILRTTEGDLAPVACLEAGTDTCPRAGQCRTLPMWTGLYDVINRYLDGITLRDLMQQTGAEGYRTI